MDATVKSADLCWAQRYSWLHWHCIPSDARHDEHLVLHRDLPVAMPLARVRLVLLHLVRRHEALRTTFHIGPDGWPTQRVHAPAPPALVVADSDTATPPAEIVRHQTVADFDLTTEPPMRAVVVTSGGEARQLVLIFQHISLDDWSATALQRELDALLEAAHAGRPAALATVHEQPAGLATREAVSDRDRREPDRAHWRAEIAALPADVYAGRRRDRAGSCSASLTSPELLEAARETAARHHVWPSVVYLSVYAMVLAACTGSHRIPFWLFTSRREPGAVTTTLTSMFAPVLVSVDYSGDPRPPAVLGQTAAALDAGKRHLSTPYDEMVELLALEGARRGCPVRVAAQVNILNYAPRRCGARRSRFVWNREPDAWVRSGADSYFRVYEWQDGVTIGLRAAHAVLDRSTTEWFLRAYEETLLALRDPATAPRADEIARRAGLPPAAVQASSLAEPSVAPGGAAEHALLTAVAHVNELPRVVPSDSYVVAGGRALRAPGVLAELAARGWRGLRMSDLLGVQSLRALADRIAPAAAGRAGQHRSEP